MRWSGRSLADEPIGRLILDGKVVRVRLDREATSISLLVRADGHKVLLTVKSMGGDTGRSRLAPDSMLIALLAINSSPPARPEKRRIAKRGRGEPQIFLHKLYKQELGSALHPGLAHIRRELHLILICMVGCSAIEWPAPPVLSWRIVAMRAHGYGPVC